MLEVINLMASLRSSVGIFVSLNYWYHSKYGILSYVSKNWYQSILILLQQMVSELMVFVQDLSALDEKKMSSRWSLAEASR